MKRTLLIAAVVILGLVFWTRVSLADQPVTRIMCLGDSITFGMPEFTTVDAYRTDLSRLLDQSGWRFQLLNNGHPGASSIDIDSVISSDLAASNPDLILYLIGTNDETFGLSYEESIFYMTKSINTMLEYGGVDKVYLAAVEPRFTAQYDRQNNLAQYQRELVAKFRREGKNVFLADQNDFFLSQVNFDNYPQYYLNDAKHLNDAGYLLMAQGWHESLTDTTPPGTIGDLKVTGSGSGKVSFSWTAPGDNQQANRVLRYLLKQSPSPITATNWDQAENVPYITQFPEKGGTAETFTLQNLIPDRLYYFALKSEDNNGNLSEISNVVFVQAAQDDTPPSVTGVTFDNIPVHDGDYISSRPLINAVIHDVPELKDGSAGARAVNPETIRLFFDDQPVTDGTAAGGFYDSYDAVSEALIYQVKNDLATGLHNFKIEATDFNGDVMTVFTLNNLQVHQGNTRIIGQALNYPNPFNPEVGPTIISYVLSNNSPVRIFIFDYGFRPVFTSSYDAGAAGGKGGYNQVTWDGRAQNGSPLPNGLYFVRIMAEGRLAGKLKIAVLK